ncbi:MAG: SMC family ATPase [Oscillospiraceae bacterium]|nr:SMC family ATPase [Oscillospiraceae bacterium]
MRPLQLSMKAFGPYVAEEVDFEKLGKTGLYLITGETGSGKTTIFDAIKYALYGALNGEFRSASMIRSKYADDYAVTEVKLVFEYKERRYTVRRGPEYERKKQRGDGTTTEKAFAELILPDDEGSVSGVKAVTEKIEDILGINGDQFSQITMIAQGRFQDIIYARSEERTQIFRSVFGTGIYSEFEKKIKDMVKGVSESMGDMEKEKTILIRQIMCPEDSPLYERTLSAREQGITGEELIALLDELIAADREGTDRYRVQAEELESVILSLNDRISRGKERKDSKAALGAVQKELSELKEKLDLLGAKLAEKESLLDQAKELSGKALMIENSLADYDELDKLTGEKTEADRQVVALSQKMGRLGDAKNELESKVQALKAERKELENIPVELEKLRNDCVSLEREYNDLCSLKQKAEAIEKQGEECDALKTAAEEEAAAVREKEQEKQEKEAVLNEKRGIFYLEQAGILARDRLREGEPCPVCGSVHHPVIAALREDAPSEEELKKLEKKLRDMEKALSEQREREAQAQNRYTKCRAELDRDREAFTSALTERGIGEGQLDTRIVEVQGSLSDMKNAVNKLGEKNERRNALDREIPEMEEQLQKTEGDISSAEKDKNELEVRSQGLEAKITTLSAKLTFDSRKKAEEEMALLKSRAYTIEEAHRQALADVNEFNNRIAAKKGEAETLEKQLSQGTDEDMDELLKEHHTYSQQREQCRKLLEDVGHRRKTNEEVRKKAAVCCDEIASLEERYRVINELSETANGQISGKKQDLETYVQTAYFDSILGRANLHLLEMSNGKYEMERREEGDSKASRYGLEINAVDHYNGTRRDIRSLSGGESFLAALSLALGLSEEVQADAGGIQLDTMFVDEGFGSLDSDTLDKAMKALQGLAGSDRLIGIISHVEQFRNEIDSQICVKKKSTGGSRAETIV